MKKLMSIYDLKSLQLLAYAGGITVLAVRDDKQSAKILLIPTGERLLGSLPN